MSKKFIKVIGGLIGILIFGILGLFRFMQYGASNCDVPGKLCDCFCCNAFGLRGYEACGNYGFLVGVSVGVVAGLIIYLVMKNKSKYDSKH